MATTTIRLDPDDEATLDELATTHGGRSAALRAGLRLLAAEAHRQVALTELLADWDAESGSVSEEAIEAARTRYRL